MQSLQTPQKADRVQATNRHPHEARAASSHGWLKAIVLGLGLAWMSQVAWAATPRSYVADKVGDALSALKKAEDGYDDLGPQLAKVRDALDDVGAKIGQSLPKLRTARQEIGNALANDRISITACVDQGKQLEALPPNVPGRSGLVQRNNEQCDRLRAIEASLVAAQAALDEGIKGLQDSEAQLKDVWGKLLAPRTAASGLKNLHEAMAILKAVLEVNNKYTPTIPEFSPPR